MNDGMTAMASVPQQEPNLEVLNGCTMSTRDTITDLEGVVTRIEDYLNGSRPEKPMSGNVEGCAAGMLSQLCQVGSNNHDRQRSALDVRDVRVCSRA